MTYPIPKMYQMLLKLEYFRYDTLLNLNMKYYYIRLSSEKINLCTFSIQGVNIATSVYQWESATNHMFPNKK